MKDGVYPISFQGSMAFMIVWRGEELQMYWGNEADAHRHLWLLNNPDALIGTVDADSSSTFADRFYDLKRHYLERKRAA